MEKHTVEVFAKCHSLLAEGPHWDEDNHRLYWIDIDGKKIHWKHLTETSYHTLTLDVMPGAVVRSDKGSLMAVTEEGFQEIDPHTGEITPHGDPETDLPTNRFNDGKCDPAGRFWAGTLARTNPRPSAALYVMDLDYTIRKIRDNVTTSNGLGWSPDHQTMYYIDTPTREVTAYQYDLANGTVSNPHTVITIPEEEGYPDGMTVDAEGMLWIAMWGGFQVTRWNPNTGEKIGSIPVPAELVTSCCFGGPELDTLYITTARSGLNEAQLAEHPHAGCVFQTVPGVKGLPTYTFKGN